jgi:hypothetical protein
LQGEEFLSGIAIVNALPGWALACIVIGACVCFSVGLQLLSRWRFGVDVLLPNQEVAGFKFAVVGVACAVLLAFVVIAVWSEYERTQRDMYAEAERFYNLHRTTYNFPEEAGQKTRQALMAYAIEVRDSDWPMMERGLRGSPSAADAITRLSLAVGQSKSDDRAAPECSACHQSHATDRRLSTGKVVGRWRSRDTGDLGGLAARRDCDSGLPAFFAAKNISAQILMTGGLAAIIGATLFLTISMNYPFSGSERLTHAPFDTVIQRMQTENEAGSTSLQ